jgi:uncharacterized protein YjeT (DUF2065 family)
MATPKMNKKGIEKETLIYIILVLVIAGILLAGVPALLKRFGII